ncbi:putative tetratricopeptide-like helical domain superfamily [Dioscorea sansibarensis]
MRRLFFSNGAFSHPPLLAMLERWPSSQKLEQVHAHAITLGLSRFTYITSRILALYALHNNGFMHHAQQLFDLIPKPTIFNWNTMIRGYSRSGEPETALRVYMDMKRIGVFPNMHTFPFVVKACACCLSLSQIHGHVFKFGFDLDVYVTCSLIKCYCDLGEVELACQVFEESSNRNVVCWTSLLTGFCVNGLVDRGREVFDRMPERNEVAWSAMIAGYVQNEQYDDSIELFRVLRKDHDCANFNDSLLVSVLTACANSGALEEGKWIHSYLDSKSKYGLELGTALVDFYAKCGLIKAAKEVFSKMLSRDVMAWTAMVMGLAVNGHCHSAIQTFTDMQRSRIRPNAVTFVGVLTACSHGGLIDEGQAYFEDMQKVYRLSPTIEHYGCMVDLLSRAGKTLEAEKLIQTMPMEPDGAIWGSLLNGCLMHGHIERGERVGRRVIELDPQHCGRYVGLANVYASIGRWESALMVRKTMKQRGVMATPGWSLIEMNDISYRFLVDDRRHPRREEICEMLSYLYSEMVYDRSEADDL